MLQRIKRFVLFLFLLSLTACAQSLVTKQQGAKDVPGLDDWSSFIDSSEGQIAPKNTIEDVQVPQDVIWQGKQSSFTLEGKYQIQIPEEWIVADLDDPTFFTIYLLGEMELARYLGSAEVAALLQNFDVAKQNAQGIRLLSYLEEALWQTPPTTMNVFVGPIDPRGLSILADEYVDKLQQRIGEQYVFTRELSDPPGKEIAYSYHLPERKIDVGFLMFFFQDEGRLILITFSGIPQTLTDLHASLEVIPFSLVKLGPNSSGGQ